ncbi:MAG: Ham1 family, partial [Candidatus Parcubacteria bacterium]
IAINALNGFPGPYLKDVNAWIGLEGYLALMARYPDPADRRCIVHESLSFMAPGMPMPETFDVAIHGTLADRVRGERRNDMMRLAPLFIPDGGGGKTYAEMTLDEYAAFYANHPSSVLAYEGLVAVAQAHAVDALPDVTWGANVSGMSDEQLLCIVNMYRVRFAADGVVMQEAWPAYPVELNRTAKRHAYAMLHTILQQVRAGKREQALRQLGFVQGVLWTTGMYTLAEIWTHDGH